MGVRLVIILLSSVNLLLAGANSDTGNGCSDYTFLNEAGLGCHKNLETGWYRFQGADGDRMQDKCVHLSRCDAEYPGWLNGTHPTVDEGVVTRKVCCTSQQQCCRCTTGIQVKNCTSYYLYKLWNGQQCYHRYCGNAGVVTTVQTNSTNKNIYNSEAATTTTTTSASAAPTTAAAITSTTETTAATATSAATATATTASTTTPTEATSTTVTTLKTTTIAALEKKFISSLEKLDALQNNSLQEAASMFTNITELYKNIHMEDVQKQTRRESILSMAGSFERFVLNYSHHHLSESTPQIKIVSYSLGE